MDVNWYELDQLLHNIIITNANQKDDGDAMFQQEIRNCAGSVVHLGIWSAKVHEYEQRPIIGISLINTGVRVKLYETSPSRYLKKTPHWDSLFNGPL